MSPWKALSSMDQIEEIKQSSFDRPVMIFKHSTTCSISSMAKLRVEDQWEDADFDQVYYLDLHRHRNISNAIAKEFSVYHESPQLLVIKDGECILDSSHLAITLEEVEEVLT